MVVKQVDVCGLDCPMPLIELNRALRDLQPGDRVELRTDTPNTWEDIEVFCNNTNNRLVGKSPMGPVYTFIVEKGPR